MNSDLPYLLPRSTIDQNLVMILAFGNLSHLEICTVMDGELKGARQLYQDITTVELKEKTISYEQLAGVHKTVIPLTTGFKGTLDATPELTAFLGGLDDRFNFSVSLYSPDEIGDEEYEDACSQILSEVREAGFRKANLVRPRTGTEVHAQEILSRKILDFVIIKLDGNYWIGMTAFVPDVGPFHTRSNERPVVSSEISISSRMAKLLLNLSGFKKGELVLDPFCGSGTIIAEALLGGATCIGVDRNPNRINDTRRNLEWLTSTTGIQMGACTLRVGDATRLEDIIEEKVDRVVTEPILLPKIDSTPSLEKARKMIRNASRLYSESLYSISAVTRKGGRVVIVTPSLRTSEKNDVSVTLQDLDEVGLRPFRPTEFSSDFPVRMAHENTKWIRRLTYVFERT